MKQKLNLAFLLFLLSTVFLNKAYSIQSIYLGGFEFGSIEKTTEAVYSWKGRASFTGGAFFSMTVVPSFFEVETGIQYLNRKSQLRIMAQTAAFSSNWSAHWIQAPLLLKFHLLPLIGLVAGGYVAAPVSSLNVSNEIYYYGGETITESMTRTFKDAGFKKIDAGLVFDGRLGIPLSPMTSFLIDLRYQIGLLNGSLVAGQSIKYSDTMIMTGLALGF